jgi:phosphonate degradation associated HDIG domain protein
MALSIDDIRMLFAEFGALSYSGEPVTQREHALQTAMLAERDNASDALIAAALLHDIGHLLNRHGDTPSAHSIDDMHQYFVLPFMRSTFPDAVIEPVRLHVDAKRCLCVIDPSYYGRLSADSVRSLALQGGVFSGDEVRQFMQRPFARDALRLRRWDDEAKVAGSPTPDMEHFLAVVERVSGQHCTS